MNGGSKKILLIVGVAVIAAAAVFAYFFYQREPEIYQPPAKPSVSETPINGKIYLTLQSLYPENSPLSFYEFSPASKKLNKFPVKENNVLTPRFSNDGKKMVFVAERDKATEIFTADSDGSGIKQITTGKGEGNKQLPIFSPDASLIAFELKPKGQLLPYPENRKIYVVGADGKEKFIANGYNPMFSPDGKSLLILKNDGLHLIDLKTNKGRLAIPVSKEIKGSGAMVSMKLSLSRDGGMLAWTNMERKQVYVIKIASWEPFQYYSVKTMLDIAAFWPVFSPDGKYLALQEAEWAAPAPKNPRLAIYDLKNFQKQMTYDLNSYKQTAMWITDWQQ
ncbi:PD40 domain-containing protein [Candidatus Wolfebacteria bacterium]|nr:PD40 domain-containing protein [Candidatus Wolfebacteria bacterium]